MALPRPREDRWRYLGVLLFPMPCFPLLPPRGQSGGAQRADHRVGDDDRERHDERRRSGTISSMAPSSSVQLERVERARTGLQPRSPLHSIFPPFAALVCCVPLLSSGRGLGVWWRPNTPHARPVMRHRAIRRQSRHGM